jgi:acetyl-CoA carboxylase biotin carboxylase subunit
VCIGPAKIEDSYLSAPAIIATGLSRGADGIHPGCGFLAENGDFAEACERSGIAFVGPRVRNIRLMADRARARRIMEKAGVPVLPGSLAAISDLAEAREVACAFGFPVSVKAAAGAGRRGTHVAADVTELEAAFQAARAEGEAAFGNGLVQVERHLEDARHVAVQVLGDRHRNVVQLGERECSIRWHNKRVLEEAPAPGLGGALRERLLGAAVRAATAIGYTNLGTVEFVIDSEENFYFTRMNARIQAGHPLVEMLTGIDLVRQGIRSAADLPLEVRQQEIDVSGHAIGCRIRAESCDQRHASTAPVGIFHVPGGFGIRVETAVVGGAPVQLQYDQIIAMVIAHGATREQAIARMRGALDELVIEGIETNVDFHRRVLDDPGFLRGAANARHLEEYEREGRVAS